MTDRTGTTILAVDAKVGPITPRPVTTDLLVEFVAWTRTADMFLSSPEGGAFGKELRDVFKLAAEHLGQKSVTDGN